MSRASEFVGWYRGQPDGSRLGPLSTEEVVQLLDAGQMAPSQLLWWACRDSLGVHFFPAKAVSARLAAGPQPQEA